MSPLKFVIFSFLSLLFLACGGEKDPSKLFQIELSDRKNTFAQNDTVLLRIKNRKDLSIEKVSFSINGQTLPYADGAIVLNTPSLGNQLLKASFSFDGTAVEIDKKIKVLSSKAPKLYTYNIINEFPHDIKAFTQGLEFYNDTLYESTGREGTSFVRKVDFTSGKILQETALDATYFGEGITVLDNTVYQLSWQNRTGFLYDATNLKPKGKFQYGESREGWGLCNDGKQLYKSDGTEKIWLLNPKTLQEEGYIQTVTNKSIFNKANELEYVDGKIYANVWQKESMMIIDAKSGAIEGVVNFGGLRKKVTQHDQLDVLNGVAYNPARNTFFVTGKNWDKLFEVEIIPRD